MDVGPYLLKVVWLRDGPEQLRFKTLREARLQVNTWLSLPNYGGIDMWIIYRILKPRRVDGGTVRRKKKTEARS